MILARKSDLLNVKYDNFAAWLTNLFENKVI